MNNIKAKGWKMTYNETTLGESWPGYTNNKVDFITINVIRKEEGYFIMIKQSIQ